MTKQEIAKQYTEAQLEEMGTAGYAKLTGGDYNAMTSDEKQWLREEYFEVRQRAARLDARGR